MQLHRAPPPRLQVFGKVVEGMDIVKAIESSPTGPGDKPIEPIVVNTIEISES
jgi:cyclophilin family peptidyl-prolyl cis-trans isomerase|tara:strand:+ start:66 stop:224 length:159 start_codon:yes stop_codon:yes gene_type:complete